MMVKKLLMAGTISAALFLGGCGSSEQTNQESTSENKQAETMTAEQVLIKSSEVSAEVKNFEMIANTDMVMEIDGESIDANTEIASQINLDPIFAYQKMNMESQQEGESIEMEMYMTMDELYFYTPEEDMWIKMSNDENEMLELAEIQREADFSQQLEQMKPFADSFQVTDKGDVYELTFAGEGEELQSFIQDVALQNIDAEQAEMIQQTLEQVNYDSIEYSYTINKNTFYPETLIMDMTMTVEEDGSTMKMSLKMNASFAKFNELGDLSIPEEVQNNATEMNLDDF
ncbi:DUF6612 family protein [Bacillus kexueae]|uniref:DUF6612 family protein n=1 Tax=Aeribacillus kexueae TaxID=2078952 RepID=UPI001FAFA708|nr:DUF6612 family protein [Bacillus kexueae]